MGSVYRPTRTDEQTGQRVKYRAYRIAYVNANGKRITEKAYHDKAASEALLRKREQEVERTLAGLPVQQQADLRRDWNASVDAYVADLERQGCGEVHRANARRTLKNLAKWCGWQALGEARVDRLTEYLAYQQTLSRAPRTLNSYRDYLAHFWDFCKRMQWVAANPFRDVPKAEVGQKGKRRRRRAYTLGELRRLLAVAGQRRDVYAVAAFSGLRRSELIRIEWRDADLDQARPRWTLRAEVTKNGLAATLPMLPDCAAILRALGPGKPTERIFGIVPRIKTLDRDLNRAGLEKRNAEGRSLDFHALRYFFCTQMARSMPIQKVRMLMRHQTMRQTCDLYLDLGIDDIGGDVWTLSPLGLTPPTPEARTGPVEETRAESVVAVCSESARGFPNGALPLAQPGENGQA